MTDAPLVGSADPRLQSGGFAGSSQSRPVAGDGLEARPALLTLVTPGGAPVCEGDSCYVPGAEGDWTEVPD